MSRNLARKRKIIQRIRLKRAITMPDYVSGVWQQQTSGQSAANRELMSYRTILRSVKVKF